MLCPSVLNSLFFYIENKLNLRKNFGLELDEANFV